MKPASARASASCPKIGDAERDLVPIRQSASADEHDRRQTHGAGIGRLRKRAHQDKAVARNPDLLVVRPGDGHLTRRHRRDVVAHDLERLRGHAEPQQPAVLVAPDLDLDRRRRAACGVMVSRVRFASIMRFGV